MFKIKFTKKQLLFGLIFVSLAVIAWRSLDICVFFDSLLWHYKRARFPNHDLALLFRVLGKEIIFPGVLLFSILYGVKLNINIIKSTVFYILGFLASYAVFQFTSKGGTNRLWASGLNKTWAAEFTEYFLVYKSMLANLLTFTPFIFWITTIGIRIIEYFKSKKTDISQENNPRKQYVSFCIIYFIIILSLSFRLIGVHYSIEGLEKTGSYPLFDTIWSSNFSIFLLAVFQISIILLAYTTYVKKIPAWVFGASCVSLFLINQLFISLMTTLNVFTPTINAMMCSAFIFFAIESKKDYLIVLSVISFFLIPLFYAYFNYPLIKNLLYLMFGHTIKPPQNELYPIWFILPNTIAFYIYNFKHSKNEITAV